MLLPDADRFRKQRHRFSGHETFPFRYPWPIKLIRGLQSDEELLLREDAIARLGVGRNMVASMRYWAEALALVEFQVPRGPGRITRLGEKLFGDDGWDPYLEDFGTLWLLHWNLVRSPDFASTWHYAFTRWYKEGFTRDEMAAWLVQLTLQMPNVRASVGTIRRDVDTFVRSYLASAAFNQRRSVEDTFDCPLVELGLLREADDGLITFARGPKPTLPVEIFAVALLDYWDVAAPQQSTIRLEPLLYGVGSPGAAFKLSEPALVSLLESLPAWTGMRYDETAGLREVLRTSTGGMRPLEILGRYYAVDHHGMG